MLTSALPLFQQASLTPPRFGSNYQLTPAPQQVLSHRSVSPNDLEAAEEAALKLRTELGTTIAQSRDLMTNARAYSDTDYITHAAAILHTLEELCEFTEALRRRLLPFVAGVLTANFAAARARATAPLGAAAGDAAAARAWRKALAELGAAPEVMLPRPPAGGWRYPPGRYALRKRKGLRGGWVAPLEMPGVGRGVPRVRAGREVIGGERGVGLVGGGDGAVVEGGRSGSGDCGGGGSNGGSSSRSRGVVEGWPATTDASEDSQFSGMFD